MIIGIDVRPLKDIYMYGGIGVSSHNLIKHLLEVDDDNKYIFFQLKNGRWGRGGITGDFREATIWRPSKERQFSKWSDMVDQVLSPFEVWREGAQLFHSLTLYKQAFWYPCKSITTIHDVIPLVYPKSYLKTGLTHKLLYHCAKNRDHIITISEYSKKDIHRYLNIPLEKISVTYVAAEERFRPIRNKREHAKIKRKFGISKDFLLYVGGFIHYDPRKNISLLLNVFKQIIQEAPDALQLVLAGKKGEYSKIVERDVRDLGLEGKVIFTDFVEDEELPLLLSAAKAFVFPSLYEGFGLPILEAMSCGLPTIAFNSSSIPEVIGDGGLLVNPNDPKDLLGAIQSLLANEELCKGLVQKGLAQAKKFSWEKTARETLEIYKRVHAG